jgi:hypothetical protein
MHQGPRMSITLVRRLAAAVRQCGRDQLGHLDAASLRQLVGLLERARRFGPSEPRPEPVRQAVRLGQARTGDFQKKCCTKAAATVAGDTNRQQTLETAAFRCLQIV